MINSDCSDHGMDGMDLDFLAALQASLRIPMVFPFLFFECAESTAVNNTAVKYEQENSPSKVTVAWSAWSRLAAGTHTIVYDLLRNPASDGAMDAAGGGGSVYGRLQRRQRPCLRFRSNRVGPVSRFCLFVDNTANATSAYGIQNGNLAPNSNLCPTGIPKRHLGSRVWVAVTLARAVEKENHTDAWSNGGGAGSPMKRYAVSPIFNLTGESIGT